MGGCEAGVRCVWSHLSKASLETSHGPCRGWSLEIEHLVDPPAVKEPLGQEVFVFLSLPLIRSFWRLVLFGEVEVRDVEVDARARGDEAVVDLCRERED